MAINGPGTGTVFATLFYPSGTWEGRQNANMKVVFFRRGDFSRKIRCGKTGFVDEGSKMRKYDNSAECRDSFSPGTYSSSPALLIPFQENTRNAKIIQVSKEQSDQLHRQVPGTLYS
jgi:hypothetical protein